MDISNSSEEDSEGHGKMERSAAKFALYLYPLYTLSWRTTFAVVIFALLSPPPAMATSTQGNQTTESKVPTPIKLDEEITTETPQPLQQDFDNFNNHMPRTLLARGRLSAAIFQWFPAYGIDIFLFTGIDKEELKNLSNDGVMATDSSEEILKKHVVDQFILLDQPEHFGVICNKTTRPVHWLRYEADKNKTFRWIRSHGKMDNLRGNVLGSSDNKLMSKNDFFEDLSKPDNDSDNQPICISGDPGVTTSVFLGHAGRKLNQIYPERNVVLITASEFVNLIQLEQIAGSETVEKAVETVLKNELGMKEDIGLEVFLDEFDTFLGGIDDDFAFEILKVIRSSFKSVRIWVSTVYDDNSLEGHLYLVEQQLNVICTKLEPLSQANQLEALISFWSRRGAVNLIKLEEFAKNAIRSLISERRAKADEDDDISDKFLWAMLMAEVYEDDAVEYSRINQSSTKSKRSVPKIEMITSIADLYQSWVNKKFEDYEMATSGDGNGSSVKLTDRQLLEMHVYLALDQQFPYEFNKFKHLFDPVQLEEILKVGILEASSMRGGGSTRFKDPTIAKYFVAWFVSDYLKREGKWEEGGNENITEFILEEILATRQVKLDACLPPNGGGNFHPGTDQIFGMASKTKVNSFQFIHATIGYFLNYLLDDIPPTQSPRPNLIWLVDSNGIMNSRVARASANSDFLHLLNYFKGLKSFEENSSAIFTNDFLCLAMRKSNLGFVKTSMAEFERHHNFTPEDQSSALRLAVQRGHPAIVDFLLEKKGMAKLVENLNDETELLLYDAVKNSKDSSDLEVEDKMKIIQKLVRINGGLVKQNRSTVTPLLQSNVHVRLLIQLINLGMDVLGADNSVLHSSAFSLSAVDYHLLLMSISEDKLRELVQFNFNDETPLMSLVSYVDPLPETLEKLKQAGADFNFGPPNNSSSILSSAVRHGRSVVTLRKLIELGADVKWRDRNGYTLLHFGAGAALPETVEFLLEEHGLDVNAETDDGLAPMNYLISQRFTLLRSWETALVLGKHGGKYNDMVNAEGQNLLHLASQRDIFNSALILLRLGKVDVNGQDKDGNTPLHLLLKSPGSSATSLSMAAVLLQNNANTSILNNAGESPMEFALKNYATKFETLQLLNSNTNVTWTHELATRALVIMTRAGNFVGPGFQPLAERLEKLGANFNYKSSSNDTLLHLAARFGNFGGVRYFVEEKGADVNAAGSSNRTPLYEAAEAIEGDKGTALKIIKFLIDNGADVYGKDGGINYTFLHRYLDSRLFGPSASQFHSLAKFLIKHNHTDLFNIVGSAWEPSTPYQLALRNKEKFDKRTFALLKSVGVGEDDMPRAKYSSFNYWGL